jgi:hypothetical protein
LGAFFVFLCVFSVTKVYHWKGKTPPKLRGRALIPVAHLLDDGFNGKLDVQLDGHSVPMNVQVFFHKPKRPQVPEPRLENSKMHAGESFSNGTNHHFP